MITHPADVFHSNLKLLSQNIEKSSHHFRVVKVKTSDKAYCLMITKNNIFKRALLHISSSRHKKNLKKLKKAISHINQYRFKNSDLQSISGEKSVLFNTTQRYNQIISRNWPLVDILGLKVILDENYELSPVQTAVTIAKIFDFKTCCQIKNKIYKHHKDDGKSRKTEAIKIFISTQLERVQSYLGKVLSKVISVFKKVEVLKNKRYFSENEADVDIYAHDAPLVNSDKPQSYFIGHATNLISVPLKSNSSDKKATFNVITDPVEGDLNAIFYPRMTKEAKKIEDCPAIHAYVLSHNHLDHYNQSTIDKLLSLQPIMMVPKGDAKLFISRGFANVHELVWGETAEIDFTKDDETYKMNITFVPARHWAGQPCGGTESLFGGYVISGSENGDVFYRGDSATLDELELSILRDKFNIVCSIEPGGPDEMRDQMQGSHQSSADALWMHWSLMLKKLHSENQTKAEFIEACKQRKTVFTHNKTFKLGNLHFNDTSASINRIYKAFRSNPNSLKNHEKEVFDKILEIASEMKFSDGELLTSDEIADIMEPNVIDPKIGQRVELA